MALTYEASATLMQNAAFVSRIKVACVKYANFVLLEATSVPAHNTRVKWANQTLASPDQSAMQVAPTVVLDPAVQADGDAVTDTALQSATEGAINKML